MLRIARDGPNWAGSETVNANDDQAEARGAASGEISTKIL